MRPYTYPEPQTAVNDAFFVMASDFDSKKYSEYWITEEGTTKVYKFKHDAVAAHLVKNQHDRDTRPPYFNSKEFIRLRTHLAYAIN